MKPSQAIPGKSSSLCWLRGCSVGRGPGGFREEETPHTRPPWGIKPRPSTHALQFLPSPVFLQCARQVKVRQTATGQRLGQGHKVGDRPRTPT